LEHPADESGAEGEREMNMNTQGKHTQRADKAINAGQVARNLRRMLAEAKGSDDVARVKDEALAMPGIYPNNEKLFMEIVADINRMNGTGPATVEDVAKLGAAIGGKVRQLEQGKRDAEEKPMDVAREVVELLVDGLELEQRNLYFAMKRAHGNQTHAAKELKVSQPTVNKALPALREAIRASGRELPEFLLPPAERKRLPDNPGRGAWGQDGIEAADTRTPFDEVAEKEESEHGPE
jgi:hypothetical protein